LPPFPPLLALPCNGFGAGNFKSLFESIEREQALRGNLTAEPEAKEATPAAESKA
jgi:hypothetical protein